MVRGLELFSEHFEAYKDDYIIIGGLATAMVMKQLGFMSRATKDIDLIVLIDDNEDFLKELLKFIKQGGYRTKQRTNHDNKHNLFRYLDPEDTTYPEQIELFTVHSDDSVILSGHYIIPIDTPESYPYLSAILLNDDYYKLLLENSDFIENVHLATPLALIPLKIHAYLSLTEQGSSDANKHLNDIIRLAAILDGEKKIELKSLPKDEFIIFLSIFTKVADDRFRSVLKDSQIHNFNKDDVLEQLHKYYS